MIIGVGTDILEISRIKESVDKFADSFIKKCFTKTEIEKCPKVKEIHYYAKRFAGKEAFFKALGTGFTSGVSWQDVEITNDEKGKPVIKISGKSQEILNKTCQNAHIHISLSDDTNWVNAIVIIEGK